jgi:F-type H+-transporting ATPase subunit b
MELFKLEPGLAIWTWIAFGVLFLILWKFFFPSLMSNIRNREKIISKSIDDANEIEKKLGSINSEYEDTIKKARSEADQILLETRKEADVLKQGLIKKADDEVKKIVSQARERTIEERQIMLQTFQDEISDFVCQASEKVIGTSFTVDQDRQLVKELLQQL